MKISAKYKSIWTNLIVTIVVLLAIFFLVPKLLAFFWPFVVGLIISVIAAPAVRFLESKVKIRRKIGSAVMIVAVIALIGFLLYGLGVLLFTLAQRLSDILPNLLSGIESDTADAASALDNFFNNLPFASSIDLSSIVSSIWDSVKEYITEHGASAGSAIGSLPNLLVGVIMMFLSAYFFIVDRQKMMDYYHEKAPAFLQEKLRRVYHSIIDGVVAYFKAQIKIMVVVYILLVIGLLILGVDWFWLVAFLAAFLDMLPVFGTGTILCPWAVVQVFSGHYKMAAGLVLLYVLTQVIRNIIQPKLIGDEMGMNTFAAILFMYLGWKFYGVLGMIIAIPVGMILIDFYKAGAFDGVVWSLREIAHDISGLLHDGNGEKEGE